jgi:hypothetical protein
MSTMHKLFLLALTLCTLALPVFAFGMQAAEQEPDGQERLELVLGRTEHKGVPYLGHLKLEGTRGLGPICKKIAQLYGESGKTYAELGDKDTLISVSTFASCRANIYFNRVEDISYSPVMAKTLRISGASAETLFRLLEQKGRPMIAQPLHDDQTFVETIGVYGSSHSVLNIYRVKALKDGKTAYSDYSFNVLLGKEAR